MNDPPPRHPTLNRRRGHSSIPAALQLQSLGKRGFIDKPFGGAVEVKILSNETNIISSMHLSFGRRRTSNLRNIGNIDQVYSRIFDEGLRASNPSEIARHHGFEYVRLGIVDVHAFWGSHIDAYLLPVHGGRCGTTTITSVDSESRPQRVRKRLWRESIPRRMQIPDRALVTFLRAV